MGPFSGAALDKIGPKLPILFGTGLMTIGILLFTVFGMNLSTGMIIGFYMIFGTGCGIAFGNTMTVGNLRLPVQQKAYGNTCFNTLMQFAGAVGTSVCAALVAAAQMQNNSFSYVRHWWQQHRCRIILSAMSKKRQQDLHMVLYFC